MMKDRSDTMKATNPKDAIGSMEPGLGVVPSTALFELAHAHADGAMKYGAHNWRAAGVRASIYRDAIDRHLTAWWEGEDRASDSGALHLAHVMACCAILIDAEACGKLADDRPVRPPEDWMEGARERFKTLLATHPEPKERFTQAAMKQDNGEGRCSD